MPPRTGGALPAGIANSPRDAAASTKQAEDEEAPRQSDSFVAGSADGASAAMLLEAPMGSFPDAEESQPEQQTALDIAKEAHSDGSQSPPRPPAIAAGDLEAEDGEAQDLALPAPLVVPPPAPRPTRLQLMRRRLEQLRNDPPLQLPSLPEIPIMPDLDLTGKMLRSPARYAQLVARFSSCIVAAYALIFIIAIPCAWKPVTVNTDLSLFYSLQGQTLTRQQAYSQALASTRAVKAINDTSSFQLQMIYRVKNGLSVFGEEVALQIQAFEQELRNLGGWSQMCGLSRSDSRFRCAPGESFSNYLWPTRIENYLDPQGYFRVINDGMGFERLPQDSLLTYIGSGAAAPHSFLSFLPQNFSAGNSDPSLIRSLFTFTSPSVDDSDFRKQYKDFVAQELYPTLLDMFNRGQKQVDPMSWDLPPVIESFFTGDVVTDYEVQVMLAHDLRLSGGALVVTILVSWLQFRSFFLAFAVTLILSCLILMTYVMLQLNQVTLATFLAMFLIFGLGGNVFFRLHAAWRRTRNRPHLPDMASRIDALHFHMLLDLLPILASSLCWLVFLASGIQPIREFGVFMCLAMNLVCILAVLCFVPLLVMHELYLHPWMENKFPRWLRLILEPSRLFEPPWKKVAHHLVEAVDRRPRTVLIGVAVAVIICLITVSCLASVVTQTGLVQLLPPDSNIVTVSTLASQSFSPAEASDVSGPTVLMACEPGLESSAPATPSGCGLHWCENPVFNSGYVMPPSTNATACSCQEDASTTQLCDQITVSVRVSGQRVVDMTEAQRKAAAIDFVKRRYASPGVIGTSVTSSSRQGASLVFEDWSMGTTDVQPMATLPNINVTLTSATSVGSGCMRNFICHCGARQCPAPSGYAAAPVSLVLPGVNATSAAASGGQSSVSVAIVFGIKAQDPGILGGSGSWSFDTSFQAASPWAQRSMLAMCSNAPSSLQVVSQNCWIKDFRDWLLQKGQGFPVDRFGNFNQEVQSFLTQFPGKGKYIWLDASNQVVAAAFIFQVKPEATAQATKMSKSAWQQFVNDQNAASDSSGNNAWPTSQEWVNSDAYLGSLSNAWQVFGLALLVICLAGFVIMLDLEFIFLIVVLVAVNVIFIWFFFLAFFRWDFGPWEMTILTVFLCFMVEPSFQLGREFVYPEANNTGTELRDDQLDSVLQGTATVDAAQLMEGSRTRAKAEDREEDADEDAEKMGGKKSLTRTSLEVETGSTAHSKGTGLLQAAVTSTLSEASSTNNKMALGPKEAVTRSVALALGPLVAGCFKLFWCGVFLLPCRYRIYVRLGGVAMLIPILSLPCIILLMPWAVLYSGRSRREPDMFVLARVAMQKAEWLLS